MLRTNLLLLLAGAIHLAYAALPLSLLAGEPDAAVVPSALGVLPLLGLLWIAWRKGLRYRPQQWPMASLLTAVVQAAGAMAALNLHLGGLHPAVNILLYLLLWIPPAFVAWVAQYALVEPPSAELGQSPYHVPFRVRTREKSLWDSDSVTMTEDALKIHVRVGAAEAPRRAPWKTVPLNEITAAGVRAAVPGEPPWVTPRNGPGLAVPSGEVAVVRTHAGDQVLPIAHAKAFVEVLRARTGRALASLPADPPAVLEGHVPEVLPAPEPTGHRVTAIRAPEEAPPTGPGLTTRWLIAVPLALLGIVGVPVTLLVITSAAPVYLAWVGVALVVWLLNLRTPRVWGRVAFLPVPLTLLSLGIAQAWLPALALLLSPILGRLAGAVFTNWRGTDLGGSKVEVPFAPRDGGLLFLQAERLVLETRGGGPQVIPYALRLHDVEVVQAGARVGSEIGWWQFPGGVTTGLPTGPLLRVVAGPQQWVLPMAQPRLLAELIRARAAAASPTSADDPADVDAWHRLRAWAVKQTVGSIMRLGLRKKGIGWRLFAASAAGTFAWMLLPTEVMRIPGAACAVLAVGLLADWARLRPRLRVAEDNPLPPGSPNWGETRSDHAPVEGWQPWV